MVSLEATAPASVVRGVDTGRRLRLVAIAVVLVAAAVVFMTIDARGNWDFVLPRRARTLAAMAVVGVAVGYSTVIFQTLTNNKILTPGIMGFDALFVLLQTVGVFFLGATTLTLLDDRLVFAAETGPMVLFSVLLFRSILSGGRYGLYTLVLVGVVIGTLFSSFTSLMMRVIDPNEFDRLQDLLFATFNTVNEGLLLVGAIVVVGGVAYGYRYVDTLDVLLLGEEPAITLGVEHRQVVTRLLALVAVLVSVSTALVGPITFLGLLVANLAYQVMASNRHRLVLPAAAMIGVIALVGGQVVLERLLTFNATLGSIINLVGGAYLILLLTREAAR